MTDVQRTEAETAWMAGVLEGEGCFHRVQSSRVLRATGERPWAPVVTVQMTDEDVIRRLADVMRCNPDRVKQVKARVGHKDTWRFTLTGWPAIEVMDACYPWLGARRRARIDELKSAFLARDPGRGPNGRFTQKRIRELHDEEWMRERYDAVGPTAIARELGCSRESVWRAMIRLGIERGRGPRKKATSPLADGEWLYRRYVDERATSSEIGAELGCSAQTVTNALHKHCVPVRTPGMRPETVERLYGVRREEA
jgi:biotin operon repressor